MKNIILYLSIISISFGSGSCSSDHEAGTVNDVPDTVTITVDGETVTFTNVEVVESSYTDTNENETIPTYNILADNGDNSAKFVAFQLRRGYTGPGGLYRFIYNDEQGSHSYSDNFTFSTSQNTDNVLEGTFSGPLFDATGAIEPSVSITEGSFSITF